ncbi:MAG: CapA family protein [Chloroflexi bacterium]|nr:CapA family protein [Chloroflexota bacterium]
MRDNDVISLVGVGDVYPRREDPESLFELTAPILRDADVAFGQLETNFSERGNPHLHLLAHPRGAAAIAAAGLDVMSFASNHTLDWGEEAVLDTLAIMKRNDIEIVGVGRNIADARRPAILERKGTKIAFLAYCSVLPAGAEALEDKLGCAPMRATTCYEQVDWQPGTPPRILTQAVQEDLAAMVDDVRKVRSQADIVVMSLHWGVHLVPSVLAMYQLEVGHAAIDAGADLILGHHAHILKGIEVYKGKVVFHSLCNFACDSPANTRHLKTSFYKVKPDPEYPTYHFPVDSRKTMIAKCVIRNKRIERVSYLPVYINKLGQPEPLSREDSRSEEVHQYMDWLCEDQGLETRFSWDGDEVLVIT